MDELMPSQPEIERVIEMILGWMASRALHLAAELGLELSHLEVEDDEAAEAQVIEQEIETKLIAAHLKRVLAADECKALTELEEE